MKELISNKTSPVDLDVEFVLTEDDIDVVGTAFVACLPSETIGKIADATFNQIVPRNDLVEDIELEATLTKVVSDFFRPFNAMKNAEADWLEGVLEDESLHLEWCKNFHTLMTTDTELAGIIVEAYGVSLATGSNPILESPEFHQGVRDTCGLLVQSEMRAKVTIH